QSAQLRQRGAVHRPGRRQGLRRRILPRRVGHRREARKPLQPADAVPGRARRQHGPSDPELLLHEERRHRPERVVFPLARPQQLVGLHGRGHGGVARREAPLHRRAGEQRERAPGEPPGGPEARRGPARRRHARHDLHDQRRAQRLGPLPRRRGRPGLRRWLVHPLGHQRRRLLRHRPGHRQLPAVPGDRGPRPEREPHPSFNPPPYDNGSYAGRRGVTSVTPGVIYSIKATPDGQTLILAGDFVNFSESAPCGNPGEPPCNHGGIIAISAQDGSLSTWRPINTRPVFELALSPDGTKVYGAAGGGGGAVLAFTVGKDVQDWQGNTDGDTLAVAATGSMVYAGGHFDAVWGKPYDPTDPDLKSVGCLPPPGGGATICIGDPGFVNNRHIAAWDVNGNPMTGPNGFHGQADTAEGPSFMLAGTNNLYVGGNFFDTAASSTMHQKTNGNSLSL